MPPESRLKPIILEKAILLFGERGYEGVTTGDLAKAANANEASIFQQFESKQGLYRAALTEINSHTERALGKALLDIFVARKNQHPRQFAFEVLRLWYLSLPQPMARFLQQVMIQDKKWRDQAYAPLGQIITALTAVLEREVTAKTVAGAKEKVENLIWALFHYKLIRPANVAAKEEKTKVEAKIRQWLQDVLPRRRR